MKENSNIFKWILLSIVCYGLSISCKSNTDKECILYNNEGTRFLQKYMEEDSTFYLDSAIYLLDKAIQCDPNYALPYHNKLNALIQKEDWTKAITLINHMISVNPENDVLLLDKGVFYAKLRKNDTANYYFKKANEVADFLLNQNPSNESAMYTKIITTALLKGKESAILLNEEYSKKLSKESFINWNIEYIKEFDRAKYIEDFGKQKRSKIKLN
ncbi:MAG: hypothetical protein NT150_12675 [Bacteroidetes bacterium]|nr:hypothetical protein [Bacteroidota bacterium]